MPFTITRNDEEEQDIQKALDRVNRETDRLTYANDHRGPLIKGFQGGRMYMQAWDDPTLHPNHEVPLGGKLFSYNEDLPEERLVAIGEACKKGDSTAVKRLLGFSRLGGTKKYVGVDLGFRCPGAAAASIFMRALPAELEELDINLQGNQLMIPGIRAVAEGLPKNLRRLRVDLTHNRIQTEGLTIFMQAIPRTVTCLAIGCGGMRMGLPGAKAIADNLPPNLTDFTVDLHDCLMGDDGCIYLSQAFPKTLEKLDIHMKGDQGYLTNRGYWCFDRLIGDPQNPHGLPHLTNDNFRCVREESRHCVQQYEVTEKSWKLVQRWLPHENVC